jgi:polyhydroxybutyrate depolymerase
MGIMRRSMIEHGLLVLIPLAACGPQASKQPMDTGVAGARATAAPSASPPATAPTPSPTNAAVPTAGPASAEAAQAGAASMVAARPMDAPTATSAGPAQSPVASTEPRPSMGCSGGSLRPGESMGEIDSAGGLRNYILFVPSRYDGQAPLPLLLDLHGLTMTAQQQERISGFRPQAETEGYVYIAPSGLPNTTMGDPPRVGNMWSDRSEDSIDLTFLRALIADIESRGCIDLRPVYVTGCSQGGSLTNLIMCTAEDIVAAVVPVCGTTFFDLDRRCTLDRPISTMLVIGKQDELNCWESTSDDGKGAIGVTCVKNYQAIMTMKDGCKGQPTPTVNGVCESVGQCDGNTEVVICSPNVGHIAYSTQEMNVAKEAWAFLKRFYLP